jgi:hypothetical protein
MNKESILSDLLEAREELDGMIEEVRKDTDFIFDSYYVQMQHIYHHLNTAWNSRKESEDRIERCSREDFENWRKFPSDDFDMDDVT